MRYRDFMILAYFAFIPTALLRRKKYDMSVLKTIIYATVAFLSGAIGAKVLYVLENLNYVSNNFSEFISFFISGGFSFFGSVLIAPLFVYMFRRPFKMDKKTIINAAVPLLILAIGIIRFGCYFEGCCGGISGVFFGRNIIWPTQLMESSGDMIIFAVLLVLEDDKRYKENLYPYFLYMYAALRFAIEFLRDTPKVWFGMSNGQVFAIFSVILATIMLVVDAKNHSKLVKK